MPAAGNRKIRPIMGGIRIAGPTTFGTLGLVYDTGLFITAGHVVGGVDSFVGQPDNPSMMGRVEANYLNQGIDIAVIKVLAGVTAAITTVWTDQKATEKVTFEMDERPEEGELLWLQGAFSGKISCSVYANDVDVNEPVTGDQLNNVVLLNLDTQSQAGDSGSPVVGEGTNICYGIYGGQIVYDGVTYGWFTPFDNINWT